MFRKLYKEANDDIIVDEALLEKTLQTAFSAQIPKKKKYNFTAISSVAAAVVVAVGCSVAYPTLIKTPDIDREVVGVVTEPEPAAVSEALIDVPEPEEAAPATQKPVKRVPKTTKAPAAELQPAVVPEVAEAVPMSRMGDDGGVAVAEHKLPMPEGYEQVSCIYHEDGSENYVFEGEDDKIISVVLTPAADVMTEPVWSQTDGEVSLTFCMDDATVDVEAQNMTREEVEEIFGDYITN